MDDFVEERLVSEEVGLDVMVSACEMSESHEVRLVTFGQELARVFLRVCLSRLLLVSGLREKNFMLLYRMVESARAGLVGKYQVLSATVVQEVCDGSMSLCSRTLCYILYHATIILDCLTVTACESD